MSREPNLDELIDAETSGEERQRLQHVHELLLEAGPPPELPPRLRKAPTFGVVPLRLKRRVVKRRALVLLAAAVAVAGVFAAGYGVGNRGSSSNSAAQTLALHGTKFASQAQATLEVWQPTHGNVPMTLTVEGLRKLPPRSYYDVYLVRDGRVEPWGICGSFRVGDSSRVLTLNFTSPYPLQKGDSWVVTRPGPGGAEPGRTVLRPVAA